MNKEKKKKRYIAFSIDGKAVQVAKWRVQDSRIQCRGCKKYLIKEMFYVSWHSRAMSYEITAYCKECNSLNNKKNSIIKATENYIYFLKRLERRAKSNAKTRGINYELPRSWWDQQYKKQEGRCYYTNKIMTHVGDERKLTNISIDRVDSSKGYTPDNCVFCCLAVNVKMKMDLTIDEMYDFSKDFVSHYEKTRLVSG